MTSSSTIEATPIGIQVSDDALPVTPRPFNPDTDVRKFTHEEAYQAAEKRAAETSIRQRIFTLDVSPADAHIQPRYLVQAI